MNVTPLYKEGATFTECDCLKRRPVFTHYEWKEGYRALKAVCSECGKLMGWVTINKFSHLLMIMRGKR